jgi:hypothetical protein
MNLLIRVLCAERPIELEGIEIFFHKTAKAETEER